MSNVTYYSHPIFLLYWIALKSKISSFNEWKLIEQREGDAVSDPVKFMIRFIEEYGNK